MKKEDLIDESGSINESVVESMLKIPGLDRESILKVISTFLKCDRSFKYDFIFIYLVGSRTTFRSNQCSVSFIERYFSSKVKQLFKYSKRLEPN